MKEGVGALVMVVFGILWTLIANQSGFSNFAWLGILFIVMAIVIGAYEISHSIKENTRGKESQAEEKKDSIKEE